MSRAAPGLLIALLLGVAAVGCGGDESGRTAAANRDSRAAAESGGYWPVTLRNAGRTLTFDQAPERVVALSQEDAELMVALGLEDRLVGYAWVSPSAVPSRYSRALRDVPVLAENRPSREVVLAANPDFIIGTMRRARDLWSAVGIKVYQDTYAQTPLPIRNGIYDKIRDIARIFGVPERGRALIQSMRSAIDAIRSRVRDVDNPVSVFVLNSAGAAAGMAATFGAASMAARLVELAGGVNVFSGLQGGYVRISWERVIAANPEVLVVAYCCGRKQQAKRFVRSNHALQSLAAVRNGRYVLIPMMQLNSMMRFVTGLRKMARAFYPQRFEAAPPTGAERKNNANSTTEEGHS